MRAAEEWEARKRSEKHPTGHKAVKKFRHTGKRNSCQGFHLELKSDLRKRFLFTWLVSPLLVQVDSTTQKSGSQKLRISVTKCPAK